jgi:hypothetical protein
MATPDAKRSVDGRVSSTLDRLKRLVQEDGALDSADPSAPRNVEEAVHRLKRKVDKAD